MASIVLLSFSKTSDKLLSIKSLSEVLIISLGLMSSIKIILFNSSLVRGVLRYSTIL